MPMIRNRFATFAVIAGLGLASGAHAQGTSPDEESPSAPGPAPTHSQIRDAHRQAMQLQMQRIQQIEDPEERARQMESLRVAMDAMRDAMRAAHAADCAATGAHCGHQGGSGRHGPRHSF